MSTITGTGTEPAAQPASPASARPQRAITIGGRRIPVIGPNPRDPRLHLALVIVSVIAIGTVLLDFRLSIPQILITVGVCAVVEAIYRFVTVGAIVWPASGMQTATSTVLVLRVVTVEHGDWWTFDGLHIFLAVAVGGLLTKYFIRTKRGHIFNPSNVALVIAFLALGAKRIEPLDYWWGPLDWRMGLAYAVILVGGLVICSRLGLLRMAVAFWLTLAAGIAILAALGQSITARWSFAPVEGWHFWRTIVLSPETMIFLFFMITDPKTTPPGRVSRVAFGVAVGIVSTLLIAPWPTEFGTKVGLLTGLAAMSLARPLIERWLPAPGAPDDSLRAFVPAWLDGSAGAERHDEPGRRRRGVRVAGAVLAMALAGSGVALAGAPNRGGNDEVEADQDARLAAEQQVAERASTQDTSAVPITIDGDVGGLSHDLATEAGARQLVAALQFNLEVEAEAIATSDASLLDAVDHGQRLLDVTALIETAERGVAPAVPAYVFETIHLGVVFPGGFQSGPNAALSVTGTVTLPDPGTGAPTTEPLATTFTLRQTPTGQWLTTGTQAVLGD
jgi:hypothetical protein